MGVFVFRTQSIVEVCPYHIPERIQICEWEGSDWNHSFWTRKKRDPIEQPEN